MKKNLLFLLLASLLLCSSCTTIRRTSETTDIATSVYQYPVVADLDVDPVKKEKKTSWFWNPFVKEQDISVVKGNLIAEILKESNADVMLEPQFIQAKVSFGERSVTVSGFVAKFKNFRKATDSDLKALEATKDVAPNERTVYNFSGNIFKKLFRKIVK